MAGGIRDVRHLRAISARGDSQPHAMSDKVNLSFPRCSFPSGVDPPLARGWIAWGSAKHPANSFYRVEP